MAHINHFWGYIRKDILCRNLPNQTCGAACCGEAAESNIFIIHLLSQTRTAVCYLGMGPVQEITR